jgi:ubiquitin-conjugating enzyme E2 Q
VISYSIPFKNVDIDPNTLCMWDDGLVEAWRENHRFILLLSVTRYPPDLDKIKYTIGQGPHYKPSLEAINNTTRTTVSDSPGHSRDIEPFYLSAPLGNYLKSFGRCYKARTAFDVNWNGADTVGMDETLSRQVFYEGLIPKTSNVWDPKDPVVKGHELNIPLVAFWWVLRRFVEAPKYCLVCDGTLEIKYES